MLAQPQQRQAIATPAAVPAPRPMAAVAPTYAPSAQIGRVYRPAPMPSVMNWGQANAYTLPQQAPQQMYAGPRPQYGGGLMGASPYAGEGDVRQPMMGAAPYAGEGDVRPGAPMYGASPYARPGAMRMGEGDVRSPYRMGGMGMMGAMSGQRGGY
jgi:hypothetical protein